MVTFMSFHVIKLSSSNLVNSSINDFNKKSIVEITSSDSSILIDDTIIFKSDSYPYRPISGSWVVDHVHSKSSNFFILTLKRTG
jgi:hypothetical protein